VDELTADAKVSSSEIRLNDFVFRSPNTDMRTDLTFQFDSFPDFDDFLQKVRFTSNFKTSTISFDDIAYFATDLWQFNRSVKLSGDFKGTVSKFRGKNVEIAFGDYTHFKGNIGMTGLPNIEETYFDVLAEEVTSSKADIEKVPLPPYGKGNHVTLPKQLGTAGKIRFNGKFTGFYNDFVAYGNITSDLGYLSSDMNLKYDSLQKKEYYKGHLSANNFHIGRLLESPDVGSTSFNVDINGSGLRLDNAETKMKGVISMFQFKNYQYKNIQLDGEISKKLFSGALTIDEENVALSFRGQINLKEKLPQYNFTADIEHLHVDTLNLMKIPGEAEISSHIEIDLTGNKLSNMSGQIQINDFNYKADKTLYHINNITLTSEFQNTTQLIHVASDNVDADFKGSFDFATIGDAFKEVMPHYFPALKSPTKDFVTHQDFTFDIRLKNTDLITERFLPEWSIAPNTTIQGSFNSSDNAIALNFASPLLRFKNYRLYDERLTVRTNRESVSLQSYATQLYYTDSNYVAAINLNADGKNNDIHFTLQLADTSIYHNRGYFNGDLTFQSTKKFELQFDKALVTVNDKQWEIDKNNKLLFDTSAIAVHHLAFASDSAHNESISLDGIISKRSGDKLDASFTNFALTNLNHLLQSDNLSLGGIMSGRASVTNALTKAQLVTDLSVDGFTLNNDSLGNATIKTQYEPESKSVQVDIGFQKRNAKTISITGQYYTARENNNLDLKIVLRSIYLPPFEKYVNTVVSNLQGKISADLALTGSLKKPVLNGTLDFSKASCKVIYLNTTYNLNDRVKIAENYFELENFSLVDVMGNKAFANGKISHNYFKNFRFDVTLNTEKFQALNTTAAQNQLYYGTAYVSGTAAFSGPIEKINMEMRLRSEKIVRNEGFQRTEERTDIHIPLGTSAEVSHGEWVTFRKSANDTLGLAAPKVNMAGVTMNMMLDITPDATIEIVFDEKIGDKITGTGFSNLQLVIDEINGFQMYGTYTLNKGTYLFTLKNVINKRFTIDPGSMISWNGSPYDADINLTATYSGYTSSLYKIVEGDSALRQRFNYHVELKLTNKLMNPNISYNINVPALDAGSESQLMSKLNTEDEMSRQVFGLLVLNQFLPPQQGAQTTERTDVAAGAGSSGLEFLSNQFNNMLSRVNNKAGVGFGVGYKPGNTYSKEEFDVMLSKSFFNDRLIVEGTFGVASDQTESTPVGDYNIEYLVSKDGRLRMKTFGRDNTNNILQYSAPYTYGVGVVYREQFDRLSDLWKKHRAKKGKPGETSSK
jgi:hypothetical protein